MAQLRDGVTLKDAGYKTLANPYDPTSSVIPGYKPGTLVNDYIAEKRAEIADDEAGEAIGNHLGQLFAGNVKRNDAWGWIFSLLCDH